MAPRGLVVLCLVLAALPFSQAVAVYCEGLTGVVGCIECSKPAGAAKHLCYLCQKTKAPVWATTPLGTITQCKATTTGTTCTGATGSNDLNCLRCNGVYCTECKAALAAGTGYYFDANYKCTASTWNTAAGCKLISKNPKCAACNPDGSCTRCDLSTDILVPQNAIYINVQFQESQCMTLAALRTEATTLGVTLTAPFTATSAGNCIEVDSTFKCARCKDGMVLKNNVCVTKTTAAAGNACPLTLKYQQYCDTCTLNKCTKCNGNRSPNSLGECAWPCKQLFGIGCLTCPTTSTAAPTVCSTLDSKYSLGRR